MPPVGSYTLDLDWVLVKVSASVTENRSVALTWLATTRSTGGGFGTDVWLIASVVGK